ncbi:MAG TPA: YCF48-related protein [Ignavibacteria bacterium]|nr:hypothetical protein [Bacteroidota bacterium]HRI84977.1 YCF48-related protein [Ignavibacteria bacterium]HRK00852.1 YCF48-related protein [Ignavibacteria bacterium]
MRLIIFLTISLIFYANASVSQTGWFQQNSNCNTTLGAVAFLNADSGFCVGGFGKILKTTNGGINWDSVDTPFTIHLFSVVILNSNEVLTCGVDRTVLKSTNFGANWYRITNINDGYNLYHMEFTNEIVGYIASESGVILKSTNSGDSWFSLDSPYPFAQAFNGLSFLDINTGHVVGYGLTFGSPIVRTTDGGMSWIRYLNPTQTPLYSVKMFNYDIGLIGDNYGLLRTSNGGVNWIETSVPASFCTDISFPTSKIAYAVGSNIIKSTDSGINWTEQQIPTTEYFNGVCFINENTGYAVGQNGTILKTTSGGIVDIEPLSNNVPDKYILYQNYPNPFNPKTVINYELRVTSKAMLKVFDVLGTEVAELVNEKQYAGSYSVEFNGIGFASGVYYYSIYLNGSLFETKRMVLLK